LIYVFYQNPKHFFANLFSILLGAAHAGSKKKWEEKKKPGHISQSSMNSKQTSCGGRTADVAAHASTGGYIPTHDTHKWPQIAAICRPPKREWLAAIVRRKRKQILFGKLSWLHAQAHNYFLRNIGKHFSALRASVSRPSSRMAAHRDVPETEPPFVIFFPLFWLYLCGPVAEHRKWPRKRLRKC
jgi:hypothetical protein